MFPKKSIISQCVWAIFVAIFSKDMTCELHDEVSAGSQFVTHLTGRILERLSLRTTPINTKAGPAGGRQVAMKALQPAG